MGLRQNGRYFADIFKCIFLNENARISRKIALKFVPKVRINNIPALVQIMAWRRPGDKFTDAYIRHSASMSWMAVSGVLMQKWLTLIYEMLSFAFVFHNHMYKSALKLSTKVHVFLCTLHSIFCKSDRFRWKVIIPPETKFRGGGYTGFTLSVRPSVCLSVRPSVRPWVGVRMITLILFSGFKFFFTYITWAKILHGIEYQRPTGFCWIPIFAFFLNFLRVS